MLTALFKPLFSRHLWETALAGWQRKHADLTALYNVRPVFPVS